MIAYRQVLDFDSKCEYCHEPLILLTSGDPALPTFHMCTCQYPRPHIIQDGVGAIPSFARLVENADDLPFTVLDQPPDLPEDVRRVLDEDCNRALDSS